MDGQFEYSGRGQPVCFRFIPDGIRRGPGLHAGRERTGREYAVFHHALQGSGAALFRRSHSRCIPCPGRMLYDGDGPAGRRRGMAQFPQPGKDGPPGRKRKYARAGNPPLPFLLRLYPGPHTPNAQGAPGEGERFVPGGK